VTGFDLVRAQLLVAAGEPLPFTQAEITSSGHAIECRVYAEDSVHLLPQAGRLLRYREPAVADVRIDSGVREGQTITVHYDALLAKVIAHGPTRELALERLQTALRQYEILGVRHNIPFLLALLARPEVATNATHTRFIEDHLEELAVPPPAGLARVAAAVAAFIMAKGPTPASRTDLDAAPPDLDPWLRLGPIPW
jgi:acetyl/propionyl-CoA carboxylase alpha subunit